MKIRNVEEWDLPGLPERLSKAAEHSGKPIARICREVKISRSFWYKVVSGEESSIALHTLSKIEKALGADIGLKDVLLSPPLNRVAGCEDPDVVRPTEIARAVYQPLQAYSRESGRPLRAVIEQAILEFLQRDSKKNE